MFFRPFDKNFWKLFASSFWVYEINLKQTIIAIIIIIVINYIKLTN